VAVFHWELGQKCVINPQRQVFCWHGQRKREFPSLLTKAEPRELATHASNPNVFEGDPREGTGPALSCRKAVRIKLVTEVPPLPVMCAAFMMFS